MIYWIGNKSIFTIEADFTLIALYMHIIWHILHTYTLVYQLHTVTLTCIVGRVPILFCRQKRP